MAANVAFSWTVPPSVMSGKLDDYRSRILEGLGMLADLFVARMAAQAKQTAPWTDRSGAARQGLTGLAQKSAAGVILYLMHTVYYGGFLETGTSKMSPNPVIMPVLQSNYAPIMSAVRALIQG